MRKLRLMGVGLPEMWKRYSARALNFISESKHTPLQISSPLCGVTAGMDLMITILGTVRLRPRVVKWPM